MGLDTEAVKPRVLLVEDEANIALALSFLLDREGYDVTHIDNGRRALEMALRDAPDLVVLDVTLPEVSGYEICQRIKASPDHAATRVLILTARGTDVEKRKALALGADDFMSKPFETKRLTNAVAALLEMC
ncbi:response regulator transcription factor [Primorskyibacter sp. S187A]|uniref:response regulator transcription factor n=1 Tax=Primorskyibacter sp. S187A TaxID=3415130 RepID=UPI003C7C0688